MLRAGALGGLVDQVVGGFSAQCLCQVNHLRLSHDQAAVEFEVLPHALGVDPQPSMISCACWRALPAIMPSWG